jgi:tRNA threonylcarbamoyladenosine biosynthesis protein TsaB
MALILCIETSTTNCSVALSNDGNLLGIREVNNGYTHAENITVYIDAVLSGAKRKYEEIDAVAVSKGPGSYTGLRIGVSAAKGICFGLNKPLISVDTLFAMASKSHEENKGKDLMYCPMIDARRMEVYCALFDRDLKQILPVNAVIIDTDSFSEQLEKSEILFFGDGAMKTKEKITHENAIFIPDVYPTASAICTIAEKKFTEKKFEDLASFEPFYLKDFIAGKGSVLPQGN